MKNFLNVLGGLTLFLFFLMLRFPYDTLVEKSVRSLEESTGATLIYTPVSAGPTGVRFKDLGLVLRSKAKMSFTTARIFPTWTGMRAHLEQADGSADLWLSRRVVNLKFRDLQVDTGNSDLGLCKFTGDLRYALHDGTGNGALGLASPKFRWPLPIPDAPLDVGAELQIKNLGTPEQPRPSISAEISLVSGNDSAKGPITIEAQVVGGPPLLSGNLRFNLATGTGILRIGGTWANPTWVVVPDR